MPLMWEANLRHLFFEILCVTVDGNVINVLSCDDVNPVLKQSE